MDRLLGIAYPKVTPHTSREMTAKVTLKVASVGGQHCGCDIIAKETTIKVNWCKVTEVNMVGADTKSTISLGGGGIS